MSELIDERLLAEKDQRIAELETALKHLRARLRCNVHKPLRSPICGDCQAIARVEEALSNGTPTLDRLLDEAREEVREASGALAVSFQREIASLSTQLAEAQSQIASLRNRLGDNLCHLTDPDNDPIPPKVEFLESCSRFWEQRNVKTGELKGCLTIAQLEEKLAEAQRERDELMAHCERLRERFPRHADYCDCEACCEDRKLLASTPTASLAAHDAEVRNEAYDKGRADVSRTIAEVQAATLREAADDLQYKEPPGCNTNSVPMERIERWLLDRAARIAKGGE